MNLLPQKVTNYFINKTTLTGRDSVCLFMKYCIYYIKLTQKVKLLLVFYKLSQLFHRIMSIIYVNHIH